MGSPAGDRDVRDDSYQPARSRIPRRRDQRGHRTPGCRHGDRPTSRDPDRRRAGITRSGCRRARVAGWRHRLARPPAGAAHDLPRRARAGRVSAGRHDEPAARQCPRRGERGTQRTGDRVEPGDIAGSCHGPLADRLAARCRIPARGRPGDHGGESVGARRSGDVLALRAGTRTHSRQAQRGAGRDTHHRVKRDHRPGGRESPAAIARTGGGGPRDLAGSAAGGVASLALLRPHGTGRSRDRRLAGCSGQAVRGGVAGRGGLHYARAGSIRQRRRPHGDRPFARRRGSGRRDPRYPPGRPAPGPRGSAAAPVSSHSAG